MLDEAGGADVVGDGVGDAHEHLTKHHKNWRVAAGLDMLLLFYGFWSYITAHANPRIAGILFLATAFRYIANYSNLNTRYAFYVCPECPVDRFQR